MAEKYISTAKVVDGVLILSLPDAVSPIVWQMELGQSKSSALEIRTTDNGQFILALKTPRQDVLEIATYANRDAAVKALLVTSQALEKAQGQLKSAPVGYSNHYQVPAVSSPQSHGGFLAVLKKTASFIGMVLGGLIVIGLILFIAGKIFSGAPTTPSSNAPSAPISADEFLENH